MIIIIIIIIIIKIIIYLSNTIQIATTKIAT